MFFVTFWPFLEILQFLMCHLTNAHDKISSKLIILKYVNICTQSFLCCMQCAFVVSKGSQRQRNSSGLSIWWHQRCFPVEWMDLDKAFYEQKEVWEEETTEGQMGKYWISSEKIPGWYGWCSGSIPLVDFFKQMHIHCYKEYWKMKYGNIWSGRIHIHRLSQAVIHLL